MMTSALRFCLAKYFNAFALLAMLDERHNTLSGPATKKLCERAYNLLNKHNISA
jgi:hypothetical protein